MKKFILLAIMAFTLALPSMSQEVAKSKSDTATVIREGNVFRANKVSNGRQSKETKTNYEYEDSKGETHPIYLSSTGKAFIKVISKKTGKEYRRYLPEVGKQINPKAYEASK
jgi:hypothetical protein